ncbi:MAG: hypothetical protein HXY40_18470 [Chloroflexi bacterium]|nr:hypothetical protein [Chloroflexota bacterium]
MRYHWLVVQQGHLPLRPDHSFAPPLHEHRPTVTLLWPQDTRPQRDNSFLVDPYFTREGYKDALNTLKAQHIRLSDIGAYFSTHQHFDHTLRLPAGVPTPDWRPLTHIPLGIRAVPCPGHAPELRALAFSALDGARVWVVSDAILDEQWLRAWRCYWPNGYTPEAIAQTWRSLAVILAAADVIVPGHGAPFAVSAALLDALIADFPYAEHTQDCPEVADALRQRLAALA